MVQRRAERDRRFLAGAGRELGDELVEVRGDPGVEVGERDGFAFVGPVVRLVRRRVASLVTGSVRYFWVTSESLKLCHLAPIDLGTRPVDVAVAR